MRICSIEIVCLKCQEISVLRKFFVDFMDNLNPELQNNSSDINESRNSSLSSYISHENLLESYVNGDEKAFERLFEIIGVRLFAFIMRYIGNFSQAEDVYQNVCIKVAMKAGTYSRKASAMAWIFQIARNTCIDVIRTKGRTPKVSIDGSASRQEDAAVIELEDKKTADPSDGPVRLELAKAIAAAVEKLPDEQREVFLLKEEGELSFEEISKIVGCGKETAKSRMRYALERLRNSLGQEARNYGLH